VEVSSSQNESSPTCLINIKKVQWDASSRVRSKPVWPNAEEKIWPKYIENRKSLNGCKILCNKTFDAIDKNAGKLPLECICWHLYSIYNFIWLLN